MDRHGLFMPRSGRPMCREWSAGYRSGNPYWPAETQKGPSPGEWRRRRSSRRIAVFASDPSIFVPMSCFGHTVPCPVGGDTFRHVARHTLVFFCPTPERGPGRSLPYRHHPFQNKQYDGPISITSTGCPMPKQEQRNAGKCLLHRPGLASVSHGKLFLACHTCRCFERTILDSLSSRPES